MAGAAGASRARGTGVYADAAFISVAADPTSAATTRYTRSPEPPEPPRGDGATAELGWRGDDAAGNDAVTLVVFGSGGHGKVVADVALRAGFYVAAFADDDMRREGESIWRRPVLNWDSIIRRWARPIVALGVGENIAREKCHERIVSTGFEVATLAHPSATVAASGRVGAGTVLLAHAVVNADARVGPGVIVNTGAIVEHDCVVEAYAHLSPNVSLGGAAYIGARSHIGLGAVILPGIRVGADVVVGAGAVVHRDVPDGLTVVGVPARPLLARARR